MTTTTNPLHIGVGTLMALGATNLHTIRGEQPARGFQARVLPFRKDGTRGTASRVMDITVTLTHPDACTITATYRNRGTTTTHAHVPHVPLYALSHTLLALDWDGAEALNPRLH